MEKRGLDFTRVLWHFASFKLQSEMVDISASDTKQAPLSLAFSSERREEREQKKEDGTTSRNDGNAQLFRGKKKKGVVACEFPHCCLPPRLLTAVFSPVAILRWKRPSTSLGYYSANSR